MSTTSNFGVLNASTDSLERGIAEWLYNERPCWRDGRPGDAGLSFDRGIVREKQYCPKIGRTASSATCYWTASGTPSTSTLNSCTSPTMLFE